MNVYVVSNKSDESTPWRVQPIGSYGGKVMCFISFYFRGKLGFLNCDICMCIDNISD